MRPATLGAADPASTKDLKSLEALSERRIHSVLLNWLSGDSERRSGLAMALLTRMGEPAVGLLLGKLFQPRCSTACRLKMLEAIEQLGHPLDVTVCVKLALWKKQFEPEVGEAISRVLERLSDHRRSEQPNFLPVAATLGPGLPPQVRNCGTDQGTEQINEHIPT